MSGEKPGGQETVIQGDERRRGPRRLLEWVARGLSWLFFIVVAVLVILVLVVPRVIGAVPLAVLSSSMEPTFRPGTLVVSQPVDPATLAIGQVITFQPVSGDPTLVTHRIIGLGYVDNDVVITTQGDNNTSPDEPIISAQVMGRVVYSIPFVGYVTNALPAGQKNAVIYIAAGSLLAYSAYLLGTSWVEHQRSRRELRGSNRANGSTLTG